MKKLISLSLLLCLCLIGYSQDDSIKRVSQVKTDIGDLDMKERTHSIFIWVPGVFTKGVSLFINKDEDPELKQTLKHIGGVTVRALSGDPESKKWKRKTARWSRKIHRKNLDDMIVIRSGEAQVRVKAGYVEKGKLKNFAVLVDAEDAAVFITSRGKIDMKKLSKIINEEGDKISF